MIAHSISINHITIFNIVFTFRREEDEWTRRIDVANSAKLELSESLEAVRSQMAALAKNYDIVGAEAKGLREQNFRLKEETSAMTTNIRCCLCYVIY